MTVAKKTIGRKPLKLCTDGDDLAKAPKGSGDPSQMSDSASPVQHKGTDEKTAASKEVMKTLDASQLVGREQVEEDQEAPQNLPSPLGANWNSWLSGLQSIGSTIVHRANQAMDQLYELASAPLPGDLPQPERPSTEAPPAESTATSPSPFVARPRRSSTSLMIGQDRQEYQQDLEDIKSSLKRTPEVDIVASNHGHEEPMTEASAEVKAIKKKEPVLKSQATKGAGPSLGRTDPPAALSAQTQLINDHTQRLVQGLGSLVNKAKDTYQDLTSITGYDQHAYPTVQDAFAAFGGQAALTRLQLQSSQAAQAFKRHVRSQKPAVTRDLTDRAKHLDQLIDELIEKFDPKEKPTLNVDDLKPGDIRSCLEKPASAQNFPNHGRCHLAHYSALVCEQLSNAKADVASYPKDIRAYLDGLSWLHNRYEEVLGADSDLKDLKSALGMDYDALHKLLTEAILQMAPILKASSLGPNKY